MKILLFDINWTLLEGENKVHSDSFNYAFKTVYGIDASINEIQLYGMIDTQIIIEVLKLHKVSEIDAKNKMKETVRAMETYYFTHNHEETYIPMKGVIELLSILKQERVPLGLLTGNVESIGWDKVTRVNIRNYFSFGAFGNMAYKRVDLIKIAKQQAEKILRKRIPQKNFILVGDSPRDIVCAKAGGIKIIAVATGKFSHQELSSIGADVVLHSLKETEKFVKFLE